jgi:hypothetical protein
MLAQTPPPAPPSPPAAVQAQPFGLGQARIGMDLAAFRARAGIACSAGKALAVTVCRGPDLALGGKYFAREPTYRFLNGRLAQIRFHSSIDAFSWVTARLKKDDGQPSAIRRDTVRLQGVDLPHVLMTWKNGRSTITLNDPVETISQLDVSITRDAAAAQLAQNAS